MLAFYEKVWYHIKAPAKAYLIEFKKEVQTKWLSVIFVARA